MTNNQTQQSVKLVKGEQHTDKRGVLSFFNTFDMSHIKRMYTIKHPTTSIVRAWQGHKIESKYFKCIKGRFLIAVVKIDNWNSPSEGIIPTTVILDANTIEILHIPKGYANGIKALDKDAELLVFSDTDLNTAKKDDYRFDSHLWMDWE